METAVPCTSPTSEKLERLENTACLIGESKGRSSDRTIVVDLPNKKCPVFVVEVKTSQSSRQKPDIVKLATLMKDMLDSAITEGASNHFTTGLLVEGPSCKVFKMTMPIKRMYCLHEISSFHVPTNLQDENLQSKLEQLILSMLQCQQLVNDSIDSLINSPHTPSPYETVDSYPSPS